MSLPGLTRQSFVDLSGHWAESKWPNTWAFVHELPMYMSFKFCAKRETCSGAPDWLFIWLNFERTRQSFVVDIHKLPVFVLTKSGAFRRIILNRRLNWCEKNFAKSERNDYVYRFRFLKTSLWRLLLLAFLQIVIMTFVHFGDFLETSWWRLLLLRFSRNVIMTFAHFGDFLES